MTAFMLTAVLLLGFAPFISTYAADVGHYQWDSSSENVSYIDLSTYFGEYEGSFVLYDLAMMHGAYTTRIMLPCELRQTPPTRYTMHCSDWKKASLLLKTPLLRGMEKPIHLKHGTQIRPYSLQ